MATEFKYEQPEIGHKGYLVIDVFGHARLCLAGKEWVEVLRKGGSSVEPLYTAENAQAAVAVALQYRGDEFERMQFEAAYLLAEHLYFSKSLGQYMTQGNTVFARECADDANERLGVWLECAKRHSAPAIFPTKAEEV